MVGVVKMELLAEACASQKFTFTLELNGQRVDINVVSESETDAQRRLHWAVSIQVPIVVTFKQNPSQVTEPC